MFKHWYNAYLIMKGNRIKNDIWYNVKLKSTDMIKKWRKNSGLFFLMAIIHLPISLAAQKKQCYVKLRVPVQWSRYEVNVAWGPFKGVQQGNGFNAGIGAGVEYFVTNRLSAESGIGFQQQSFNIVRPLNQRFWGNLNADVINTRPRYSYSLLQIPVKVNYRISRTGRYEWFAGAANYFNFTFNQRYATGYGKNNFYFFSNAVQVSARLQYKAGGRIVLAGEPFLQVYHQWKKDEILFDYNYRIVEPGTDVTPYNKQAFDAAGIAFSISYQL